MECVRCLQGTRCHNSYWKHDRYKQHTFHAQHCTHCDNTSSDLVGVDLLGIAKYVYHHVDHYTVSHAWSCVFFLFKIMLLCVINFNVWCTDTISCTTIITVYKLCSLHRFWTVLCSICNTHKAFTIIIVKREQKYMRVSYQIRCFLLFTHALYSCL